jgi:hypothetical protein
MKPLTDMTLTELTRLRRDVLAAIKSRRPKREKVKVRRVVSAEARERARLWDEFGRECREGFCWACGRTAHDRPGWWNAPWTIERMHFVHSGTGRRVNDRRLAISGCSGCHGQYHKNIAEWDLPPLSDGQCVWLKRLYDAEWYSPLFIAGNNIRGEIEPEKLPQIFQKSFVRFQR